MGFLMGSVTARALVMARAPVTAQAWATVLVSELGSACACEPLVSNTAYFLTFSRNA